MNPDRLAELIHLLPERSVLRQIDRLAADIGVDLHTKRPVLDRALGFRHAGVRGAERHLRDPGREAVLLLVAQFGKAVVAEADHLVELLRGLAQALEWR